ncbi:MAG TPA: response regulator transcription factor [Ornithinicoccus sp.]|nr:response regulator transcription factor [Ornithinicoccus sp.]
MTDRSPLSSPPAAATAPGHATSVLVVDDQELVRMGFRLILERAGLEVLGEAGDGIEAVEAVRELRPDVVLMDIRMPRLDGVEATRRIVALTPPVPKVLVLTTFDLDEYVYQAVRAGASGFLLKDVRPEDLVHAVHVVARGESMLAPSLIARLLEQFTSRPRAGTPPPALADLTAREMEVARLVARGLSNAEIGARLFLSEATVKTYVSRILTKLDLRDRLQIAVLAYQSGLVQAGEAAD